MDLQLSVFRTGVQSGPVPGSGALPGDCTTHAALNDSGRKLVELGGFTIALLSCKKCQDWLVHLPGHTGLELK